MNMKVKDFTIGADPEIFLRSKGAPISAHGLIGGTKEEPLKTSHGAIQVDGLAVEFNIDPSPLDDFETFNHNIVKTKGDLKAAVLEGRNGEPTSFYEEPTLEFGKEFLDTQPDEAKELGCDPDYNAYTLSKNPAPSGEATFRTGAGHIHLGWGSDIPVDNQEHLEICANITKVFDCFVGLYMTCIEGDNKRRQLYGKAGAFRPKPYGFEYRTPSNVWIKNKNRRLLMFNMVKNAVGAGLRGVQKMENLSGRYRQDQVVQAINTGNAVFAFDILRSLINFSDVQLLEQERLK